MAVSAGSGRRWLMVAAWVLSAASPRLASGQVIHAQAGTSSLYDVDGGSVSVQGRGFDTTIGVGWLGDELRVGGRARTVRGPLQVTAGDEALDFQLPTDLFGGAHYVPTRGVGVSYVLLRGSIAAFAGATSTRLGSPFFQAGTWDDPAAIIFADRRLGRRWRAVSRNIIASTLTSLHGAEYEAGRGLVLSTMAGVGNDKPYAAFGSVFERPRWRAIASYIATSQAFRRIVLTSISSTEAAGANVAVDFRPRAGWSLRMAHQNLIDPTHESGDRSRVQIDQVGGGLSVAGVRVSGGLYSSRSGDLANLGTSLSVGRALGRVDVNASGFRSSSRDGQTTSSVTATVREPIGPRLSIVQMVTVTEGQTSLGVGGSLNTNLLSANLDYQTVYAPFRLEDPFVRAMTASVRLQPFGNWQFALASTVLPNGAIRYTASASQFFYHGKSSRPTPVPVSMPRYAVRGRVIDQSGQPVSRAVLQIGEVIVLTGDDGRFFSRMKRSSPVPLDVLTAEFPPPGPYRVVSAPLMLTPTTQDSGPEDIIIVSRERRSAAR